MERRRRKILTEFVKRSTASKIFGKITVKPVIIGIAMRSSYCVNLKMCDQRFYHDISTTTMNNNNNNNFIQYYHFVQVLLIKITIINS